MSKERELLERVSKLRDIHGIHGSWRVSNEYMRGLYNGLELALSLFEDEREPQYKNPPAQPEQEPVATKLDTPEFQSFKVSFEDAKKLKELPVGTQLFTASPPKPEPSMTGREMYQRGYAAGVRVAEKAHGIGDAK